MSTSEPNAPTRAGGIPEKGGPDQTAAGTSVALSLISHTNAGKTTLARTLLGRDVGIVRDGAHVTQEAFSYRLIDTPEGDTLLLWDTPGFGDSARLARRLSVHDNPVKWFLLQVWDRFRDRAFWLTQKAVRNVRDDADVVLYLVNASEEPGDAGYLGPELNILEWIGKPVIVLLNQTGPPRSPKLERMELDRWREALGYCRLIRHVTALDAFTRCWVREIAFLRKITECLAPAKREGYGRLLGAWEARRNDQFDRAMQALSEPLAAAACDCVYVPDPGLLDRLRVIGEALKILKKDLDSPKIQAIEELARRLDARIRESTDELVTIYGLTGRASDEVRQRMTGSVTVDAPVSEGGAAIAGGLVTGALSGLAADLAAGGLSMGLGALTGAALGAAAASGLAHGVNLWRGKKGLAVRWDEDYLTGLVRSALLRYLAVSHYGRGRGEWVETEYAPYWPAQVTRVVSERNDQLKEIWALRDTTNDTVVIAERLKPLLRDLNSELFRTFYADE